METRYLPLFVYGTLSPGSRGYGSTLRGAVREIAPAFLPQASLYIGPSYPLAVRDKNGTGVYGTVMLLEKARFDDILFELDEYEGYVGEGRSDNLYLRSVATVDILPADHESAHLDGEDLPWQGDPHPKAYVYLATPETFERMMSELVKSPSGNWHNHDDEWDESGLADADFGDDDVDSDSEDEDDTGENQLLENQKPKIEVTDKGTVPIDRRNFRKRDEFDPDDDLINELRIESLKDSYKDASYNEDDEN